MKKQDLLDLRQFHHLKQEEIACVFGITQGAWSFYESEKSGRRIPLYIQRAVTFFVALSRRRQRAFVRRMLQDYGYAVRG